MRQRTDWQWDPAVVLPENDPMAARRYLDFGPLLPQVTGSLRAGTLIAENIDLYGRGAFGFDARNKTTTQANGDNATYYELGGAVEVRLRRTLSFTATGMTRQIIRDDAMPVVDDHNTIQPFPQTRHPFPSHRKQLTPTSAPGSTNGK